MSGDRVEASFRALRYVRTIARHGARLRDPGFWRELNPELTVSDEPPIARARILDDRWAGDAEAQTHLRTEGFLVAPPIFDSDDCARLRAAVTRIVDAGLPPGCALVYDEIYRVITSLGRVLEPILGPTPALMPEDSWVFFVPPGDAALTYWTAYAPHRDWAGGDPALQNGGLPTMLATWVALSDAGADNSCMYVVPSHCDRGYLTRGASVDPDDFRLQDVRACPVVAGQMLLFSTHLVHWGSRSSRTAPHPRVSLSLFAQRADMPRRFGSLFDPSVAVPLDQRLIWTLRTMRMMLGKDETNALGRTVGLTLGA